MLLRGYLLQLIGLHSDLILSQGHAFNIIKISNAQICYTVELDIVIFLFGRQP